MGAMRGRIRAIDWLRGLVMVLMTVDHAGAIFDARHLHGDSARGWVPGTALDAGEFWTRWITHLCAPTFVLLAGASIALSTEKRRERAGQTRFLVARGLLIAALDPAWMSLGFTGYRVLVLQVLYAIGLSMVCMAGLRFAPSWALVAGAVAMQAAGEWIGAHAGGGVVGALLWSAGPVTAQPKLICAYPLLPWLAMMMLGFVLGRWLLATKQPLRARAAMLALLGVALIGVFAGVRGADGYGNWGLHRDSMALVQWMHVAKYPPSIAYTALELGLAFVLLALFLLVDRDDRRDDRPPPRALAPRALAPLATLGATAFFFYVLHVHLLALASFVLGLDRHAHGLAKTYVATAAVLVVLVPLCVLYRRYKVAHPDGWTRFL
jgi:uncharacterized membrane protein